MINIKISKNSSNEIIKFEIKGHAGYAAYGHDIVCAAISTIAQATIMGIQNYAIQDINYRTCEQEGWLICEIPSTPVCSAVMRFKADVLLNSMLDALIDIQKQYSTYITIEYN